MLDITVIAFSSKSPGTKYLFVGRSSPFSSSCTAAARISSARTAPGGTSPPTAFTSSVKLGLSPSKHKSKGEPSGPMNLGSKCHECKTRAGWSRMVRRPTLRTVLDQCQLGHSTDFLSGESCSDSDARCVRDSPLRIALKHCLMNKSRLCNLSKALVCHARSKHYASERAQTCVHRDHQSRLHIATHMESSGVQPMVIMTCIFSIISLTPPSKSGGDNVPVR